MRDHHEYKQVCCCSPSSRSSPDSRLRNRHRTSPSYTVSKAASSRRTPIWFTGSVSGCAVRDDSVPVRHIGQGLNRSPGLLTPKPTTSASKHMQKEDTKYKFRLRAFAGEQLRGEWAGPGKRRSWTRSTARVDGQCKSAECTCLTIVEHAEEGKARDRMHRLRT